CSAMSCFYSHCVSAGVGVAAVGRVAAAVRDRPSGAEANRPAVLPLPLVLPTATLSLQLPGRPAAQTPPGSRPRAETRIPRSWQPLTTHDWSAQPYACPRSTLETRGRGERDSLLETGCVRGVFGF
ncbi:hypothetical protein BaRGS_00004630, partial [Batillaria attramentaria]